MNRLALLLVLPVLLAAGYTSSAQVSRPLVLEGGTLLDLSHFGASTRDIRDAVVVIRGDTIAAAGPRGAIAIPPDAQVIDATERYVVPGYFDAFATVNNQAQANAYLYMGVTSIVGIDDPGGRRGPLFRSADPGPSIYPLARVGSEPNLPDGGLVAEVERLAASGVKVLLLYYSLRPNQVALVAKRGRELGLATIGELGSTTYDEGTRSGVMAFVHTSRYSLDLAPSPLRTAVAAEPFGPPRIRFYQFLNALRRDDPALGAPRAPARLGEDRAHPDAVVELPRSAGSCEPLERTGRRDPQSSRHSSPGGPDDRTPAGSGAAARRDAARHDAAVDDVQGDLRKAGAKYLAGSGTDASGRCLGSRCTPSSSCSSG